MTSRQKKQVKRVEGLIKDNNNRSFHHNIAVHELRAAAKSYNDPILNEAIEKCAQIIFNQDETLNEWELDRIFNS